MQKLWKNLSPFENMQNGKKITIEQMPDFDRKSEPSFKIKIIVSQTIGFNRDRFLEGQPGDRTLSE